MSNTIGNLHRQCPPADDEYLDREDVQILFFAEGSDGTTYAVTIEQLHRKLKELDSES